MKIQKQLLAFCTLLLFTLTGFAQAPSAAQLAKDAMKRYDEEKFEEAGALFDQSFALRNDKAPSYDRYNAACCWALANKSDNAFKQLFRIAEKGNYTNYDHITKDTDLTSLYEDERWEKVIEIVKKNKEAEEVNYNWDLVNELKEVYQEDQKYRRQIGDIEKEFGRDSDEMKAHWELINEKDEINTKKVTAILDEHGWLGKDIVSNQGASALFLVIQHADIEIQQKYLPMMREAVKDGKARGSSLALLEDRVALRTGKKQIYGSQVSRDKDSGTYFLKPMVDPMNVDTRRAEVGLPPLADYVANWDMKWDAAAYTKGLPALEKKLKKAEKKRAKEKKKAEKLAKKAAKKKAK